MIVSIKYCNNIDDAEVEIKEAILNIKYAINGAGKSTVAKAIRASVTDRINHTNELENLRPFKAVGQEGLSPTVSGVNAINNIMVFDELYISDFVFQPDELVKGSFDIFIRDDRYEDGVNKIENLVREMKALLSQDKDIEGLINDFNELSASFGKETKTGIHGSSSLSKAFKSGNKVINIPEGLEIYKDYIQHDHNYKWIKWQLDGKQFIEVTSNCPFCVNGIEDRKETIKKVSDVYESKSIENLNKIVAVFQRLNIYFSSKTKKLIEEFIVSIDGYSDEHISYLLEVKSQIDRLKEKFEMAQKIGFLSLKSIDKLIEGLKTFKIDINLYNHLDSDSTIEKVNIVNSQLDSLLSKVGELQGHINQHKSHIEKLVKEHRSEINYFLQNAGYSYRVDLIEGDEGEHRLKLLHVDMDNEVAHVKSRLSYGEKNAFALVLFMYDVLKNMPDIIVLDDPISSFDKNKKYAIVDMLFRKECCFRGKTVLLLTHDFEPIVDMVLHHRDKFDVPLASFLENNRGQIVERPIGRDDIKTFIVLSDECILRSTHIVNKLIYLRRLYELSNKKGLAYQVISNLLHKRDALIVKESGEEREMISDEFDSGVNEILDRISDFNYHNVLAILKDDLQLTEIYNESANNYEKLHIYRILYDDKKEVAINNDVINKFIKQSFHIENDYIYQLDPSQYQTVPQYIIDECDKYIQNILV